MKNIFIVLLLCLCLYKGQTQPAWKMILDSSSEWSWDKDSELFKNVNIKDCLVGVNVEPLDYDDAKWDCIKSSKVIGSAKYQIFRIELNRKLWCYTYMLDDSSTDQLNVYMLDSCQACLDAIEKLIVKKDSSK